MKKATIINEILCLDNGYSNRFKVDREYFGEYSFKNQPILDLFYFENDLNIGFLRLLDLSYHDLCLIKDKIKYVIKYDESVSFELSNGVYLFYVGKFVLRV